MYKIFGIAVLLITLAVYSVTTSPYLQAGDSAEMAAVGITRGVPHQPSYPLYTALSHYFTKLPLPVFNNLLFIFPQYEIKESNSILIYRTGLFSAVLQSFAVFFFYLVCIEISKYLQQKETTPNLSTVAVASITSLIYAASTTIWLYATKPEVFALNNMFATLILYLAVKYLTDPSQVKLPKKALLLFGLALGHHQTIVLIVPSLILIYLYKQQTHLNQKPLQIVNDWISYSFEQKFNKVFPYLFCMLLGSITFFVSLWINSQAQPFINWGQISNIGDLVRALVRADYGIIGAYLSNTPNTTIRIDQIPFFVKHISNDISVYVIVISIIGYLTMFRQYRNLQKILLVGFLFTGPIFLMYANFSLDSEFSKATVVRFYMLPTLFILLFFFCGVYWINNKIIQAKETLEAGLDTLKVGHGLFLALLFGLLINLVIKNIPQYDNLTYHYARTTINTLENNALVMVTGDIPTMTMQYMQAVEGEKKNRTIFSPGQFHLEWFQRQLRTRYPELKIPPPQKGKLYTSATQVVDANWGKYPIYVSPEFIEIDPELQKKYLLWPRGLLLKVEKPETDYKLEAYLEENTKLYDSINMQEFAKLRSRSYQLESPLITFYARHFFNVGAILNAVHRYDDAVVQFNRSLSIDPNFSENYKALGNLHYLTQDYPHRDPQLAIQYYTTYLQTSKEISVEQYNSIVQIIQQINDENSQRQQLLEQKAANELKENNEASSSSDTSTKEVETNN